MAKGKSIFGRSGKKSVFSKIGNRKVKSGFFTTRKIVRGANKGRNALWF